MITRVATTADIAGILELQAKNLLANLAETERADGFVTTPFTVEQLQTLIDVAHTFVAEKEGRIVGYALAGSWDFYSQWPIFPYMISRFSQLSFQGTPITADNSFQYGPICIDQVVRGSGVFQSLFETMRQGMSAEFPIGLTFINKANPRSFAAHTRKLNLEVIDEFEFNQASFYGLGFATASNK